MDHNEKLQDTMQTIHSTEKSPYVSEVEPQTRDERDVHVMAKLGKKPALAVNGHAKIIVDARANTGQRRFGFISIFGFMSTILVTWEGSLM
jgi:hypothetical protein